LVWATISVKRIFLPQAIYSISFKDYSLPPIDVREWNNAKLSD
jgi:hypothetical protein